MMEPLPPIPNAPKTPIVRLREEFCEEDTFWNVVCESRKFEDSPFQKDSLGVYDYDEALGSATDFWTAFREGAFRKQSRPFLGWIMLLEDCKKSNQPVKVNSPIRYLSAKLSACDAVRGNIFNINCFPLVAQQQAHE